MLDVEREERAAKLTDAIALAEKNGIRLCLSNPCFEVWLVAHFEATSRPFADCAAAGRHLEQRHWQPTFGTNYDKADADLYHKMAGLMPEAIFNAQTVREQHYNGDECRDCNSSTEVYELVRRLLTPG